MKIYLILTSLLTLLYGCPVSIRENTDTPEAIENGEAFVPGSNCVLEDENIIGERVFALVNESTSVQCENGFEGGGEYRCLPSGEFEGEPCERIQCAQKVPHKNNSEELILLSGESVELECAEGYGDAGTWSCSFDGELSGNPCRRKCVEEVPNLQGKQYVISYFGDEVFEIDCEEGYYSEAIYQCNENGEFNFSPKCSPIRCDALPAIDNSNINAPVIGKLYGEEVEIRCDEGTYGNQTISCSSSGSWEIPTCNSCPDGFSVNDGRDGCVAAVCVAREIEHSNTILEEVNYNPTNNYSTNDISCNEGYELSSNEPWVCTATSDGAQWQGPSCEAVTCPERVKINFTTEATSDFPLGEFEDTHTMNCADGYDDGNGNNSSTWTCNENGSWGGNFCRKTGDCMANSTNLASGHTRVVADQGETVSVYCDYGYEPREETLTCESNGSGGFAFNQLPTDGSYCAPVECAAHVSAVSNSTTTPGLGVFGETLEVICAESLIGESSYLDTPTWTCGGDGNWSGEACVPFCEITVENSIEGTYKIPEMGGRQVKCNSGFKGSSYVSCEDATSNATDINPVCETYTVSTPDAPLFSEVNYAISSEVNCDGDMVTFPDHSFALEMLLGSAATITLPVDLSNEGIDFYVFWDDGQNCSHITSSSDEADLTHVYPSSGATVKLRIIGTLKNWGKGGSTSNYKSQLRKVLNLGAVGWEDLTFAFYGTSSMTEFNSLHTDTSNVQVMKGMFASANSLVSLDLSNLDTSSVTDMTRMFNDSRSLTRLDLSNIDTSNVTSMQMMFYRANSLESLDLSSFTTSNVTDMSYMFEQASSLTSLDLSNFDTSKVTNMDSMFKRAGGLEFIDLSSFDTSSVTSMRSMFEDANSLKSLDVSSFNTSKVTNMDHMFATTLGLRSLDLSNFDTFNVTVMDNMFNGITGISSFDLSNFVTVNVQHMSGMFYSNSGIKTLDLSSFDTSKVQYMEGMFQNASSLPSLDLSSFYTPNLINMDNMFDGMELLESLNISNFSTKKIYSLKDTFKGLSNLHSLDLSSFDTYNVSNMSSFLEGTASLSHVDLSSFNTNKLLDLSQFLKGVTSLTRLNLSSFDLSYTPSLEEVFYNNNSLEKVNFGKWGELASPLYDTNFFGGDGWNIPTSMPKIYCDDDVLPLKLLPLLPSNFLTAGGCLPPPMIVTFTTTSPNEVVTLGINGGSVTVDWGDGDEDSSTTHSYDYAGTYEVWIEGANTLTEINNNWSNNLVKVNALGDLSSVATFTNPFKNKTNLKLFSGFGKLSASLTNLSSMFEGATSLRHVDFSKIDTSNISNINNFLKGAANLRYVDLGDFNREISDTTDAFLDTPIVANNDNKLLYCTKEYVDPTESFPNEHNWTVTLSGEIFSCENNLIPLVLEISTNENEFNLNCDSVKIIDWGDASDLEASNGPKDHEYEGSENRYVKVYGECDLWLGWDDSKNYLLGVKAFGHDVIHPSRYVVGERVGFFQDTPLSYIEGYGRFSPSKYDADSMFAYCGPLESADFSNFDSSYITIMSNMFEEARIPNNMDLSNFDTSNVENMEYMFGWTQIVTEDDESIKSIDLSSFDTSKVTNMTGMFTTLEATSLNLGYWETNSLINSSGFFNNAGDPPFSSSGENLHLFCENDDDSDSLGFELFINNETYSCDGEAP